MEISYPAGAAAVIGPSRLVPLTVRVWFAEGAKVVVVKSPNEVAERLIFGFSMTVTVTFAVVVVQLPESAGVKVTL